MTQEPTEVVHDGRVTRRRMLLGTAGAVGAAAFLAACGDDDDSGRRRRRRRRRRRHGDDSRRRIDDHRCGRRLGDHLRWRRWRRADLATLLGSRGGQRRQGQDDRARRGAGADRHRFVLRQDDEPRPRSRGQAHRRARRPDVQVHVPRPQVRRRRRPACRRWPRSSRKGIQAKFASYTDDIGAMLVVDGGEQGVHARRRWWHEHLRPGPAVLLGHPGDHAERPDARPVQVDARRPTRTPRRSASSSGTSARTNNNDHQDGRPRQDRRRRLRVQQPLRAGPDRWPGLLPGAAEGQGQRARPPAGRASTARTRGRSPTRPRPPASTSTRIGFEFTPDGLNASKGTYDSDGYTFAYDYFDPSEPKEPAGQEVRRGLQRRQRRGPRLLRGQLLRERVRDVGGACGGSGPTIRKPRSPARPSTRRCRRTSRSSASTAATTRRSARYTLDADDALGHQARDGRVRVQGRNGHPEGVLRHRRVRLQDSLTP